MKTRSCATAAISLAFVLLALVFSGFAGTTDKIDELTGLPVYPGTQMPQPLAHATFCKSATQSVMYRVAGVKVEAVTEWYTTRLKEFPRYHSNNGRSRDSFFQPDGTVDVTVTGVPGNSGNLFAISFDRFQPPLTKREMET